MTRALDLTDTVAPELAAYRDWQTPDPDVNFEQRIVAAAHNLPRNQGTATQSVNRLRWLHQYLWLDQTRYRFATACVLTLMAIGAFSLLTNPSPQPQSVGDRSVTAALDAGGFEDKDALGAWVI